jgi:transposase-like protein
MSRPFPALTPQQGEHQEVGGQAARAASVKANMLERINQELKRRTHVIRIFPNEESCLRLIRALAVEIHEDWIEAHRYLNMEMLREQRKQLQLLEAA